MNKFVLGVDIGGTNSRLGFVDEAGRILAAARMETKAHEGPEALWARIWREAQNLLNRELSLGTVRPESWLGIGIGAPNAHSERGTIEYPPNLGWDVVHFLEIVRRKSDIPAWLSNDANVAALGEGRFGAARGQKHFVLVTLGTGVGSGLVVDGSLVEGYSGFASEIGHLPMVDGGRLCGCGQRGCLETYTSANGLKRTVLELLVDGSFPTKLGRISYEQMNAELISKAAEDGDLLAREALATCARYLARGLVVIVHLLSPQAVYLGGGVSRAGDWLMKPLIAEFQKRLMPVFKGSTTISVAAIPEAELGIVGAAALAFSNVEKVKYYKIDKK